MKKIFLIFFLFISVMYVNALEYNETFGTGSFYNFSTLYGHNNLSDGLRCINGVTVNNNFHEFYDNELYNIKDYAATINDIYCFSQLNNSEIIYLLNESTGNKCDGTRCLHGWYNAFGVNERGFYFPFGGAYDLGIDSMISYCGSANNTDIETYLQFVKIDTNSVNGFNSSLSVGLHGDSAICGYSNANPFNKHNCCDLSLTQLGTFGTNYGCVNYTLYDVISACSGQSGENITESDFSDSIGLIVTTHSGVTTDPTDTYYLDNLAVSSRPLNQLPEFNISITSNDCYNSSNSLDKIDLDVDISSYDSEGDTIYYSFNNVRVLNYTNLYYYTKPFCSDVICVNRPDHDIFLYKFYQPYSNTCGISENDDGDFNYALIDDSYWLQLWNCSETDKSVYFKEDVQGDYPVYKFDVKWFDTYDYLQVSMLDGFMKDKIGFYITRPDNSTYVVWNYADTQITNFSWYKYDPIFINLVTNLTGSLNVDLYISNSTGVMAQASLPFLTDVEFNGVLKLSINESTTLGNSYIATGWSYEEDVWSTSYDNPMEVDQHIHYRYYVKISDHKNYPDKYNYEVVDVYLPECEYKIQGLDTDSEHFEDDNFNPFVLINTLLRKPFSNYLRQLNLDVVAEGILGLLIFIVFFMMLFVTQNFSISIISVSLVGGFLAFIGNLNSFPVYIIMLSVGIATVVLRAFNGQ